MCEYLNLDISSKLKTVKAAPADKGRLSTMGKKTALELPSPDSASSRPPGFREIMSWNAEVVKLM